MDRHCNRLDANLVKFEENHPIGKLRIASLPGLSPSSKSLREYSKLSSREKITKKINDRKESQSAKSTSSKQMLVRKQLLIHRNT